MRITRPENHDVNIILLEFSGYVVVSGTVSIWPSMGPG